MAMEPAELRAAIEAILFVSTDPVRVDDLVEAFAEEGKDAIITQLDDIKRGLETTVGGFMLEQTAGGWRFATRAEHDPVLKKYFAKKGENRLSLAALETLAIVAYRQPITAPEISEIRGVNSTGVVRTLLERRMIRVAGRKNVVGSPFLYRTTKEFLVHFGLNDIRDLPRLEEFGDLIGESLGDDVVAAIANADDSQTQGMEVPLGADEMLTANERAAEELAREDAGEAGEASSDDGAVDDDADANDASDDVADDAADEAIDVTDAAQDDAVLDTNVGMNDEADNATKEESRDINTSSDDVADEAGATFEVESDDREAKE
ncbi:MAG TPA: SMC-Scp complex subunit ScpB [Thermoanaerobaculia bacterium]|nr:SMC-Scp complex subunit ScpB [Thermoanaerobaculia bacterium]